MKRSGIPSFSRRLVIVASIFCLVTVGYIRVLAQGTINFNNSNPGQNYPITSLRLTNGPSYSSYFGQLYPGVVQGSGLVPASNVSPGYTTWNPQIQIRAWSNVQNPYFSPSSFATNIPLPQIVIRFPTNFPTLIPSNVFLVPTNLFIPQFSVNTNRWRTNFFRYPSHDPFSDNHGILWQHKDGRVALWGMNNTNFLGATLLENEKPSLLGDSRILGLRDFDHDGQLDLLLRTSRGQLGIGTIRENKLVEKKVLDHLVPREWKCLGVLDFGYSYTWILWDAGERIIVWIFNENTLVEHSVIGARFLSAVGIGDFNNDQSLDILWQKNGLVGIDFLDWDTVTFSGPLWRSRTYLNNRKPVTAGWRIVANADFNGDHQTDILWKNEDGRLAVWLMNGTERVGAMLLRNGQQISSGWDVVSIK